ncbi:MAG: hypothetical protein ND807_13700, partial [Vicinamibacterales bacterium]|nr:hypothetical protein [Vicinamibacterales bacterium]
MERRFERQRLGLEPAAIADGLRSVDDLLEWWIENFLRHAPSYASTIATIRKHLVGSKDLGRLDLEDVSPGKFDLFLTKKERELSPQSVNHLRGFLRRAFNLARRMEKFPRPNPVADVPKRKVPKRLPDYLRPNEVPPLLASVRPKWRALFATAIYTGLRKGELFALGKSDVDLAAGIITVCRSHDPRTTTEFYGHLAGHYLKREMERLSFGPPAAAPGARAATSPPPVPQEPQSLLAAGGDPESPLPAALAR